MVTHRWNIWKEAIQQLPNSQSPLRRCPGCDGNDDVLCPAGVRVCICGTCDCAAWCESWQQNHITSHRCCEQCSKNVCDSSKT